MEGLTVLKNAMVKMTEESLIDMVDAVYEQASQYGNGEKKFAYKLISMLNKEIEGR